MSQSRSREFVVLTTIAAAGWFAVDRPLSAQQSEALGHGYSRPARSPHGSRSEVIAPLGMVATSHPLAAQVGMAAFADATLAWLENEEPGLAERLDLAEKALRDLL